MLPRRTEGKLEDSGAFVGIDLGGTEIKAALLDTTSSLICTRQIPTRAREGREAVLTRMLELLSWVATESTLPVSGVGIATPGVVDMKAGRVELLTNLTADWNGFDLTDAVTARTGLPAVLLNDVRAATLAEHLMGAGQGYTDFICIAIGTGLGGGLVLNGELFLGSRAAAGEIGHFTVAESGPRCTCGNVGCLEAFVAAPAITRAAREAIAAGDVELLKLTGSESPNPQQIAEAAAHGSSVARGIYARAGEIVGRAMSSLICVLNPQAIVIGGGVAEAGDLLLEPIRREIARRTVVFTRERGGVVVLQSPLRGQAGAIGAAAWSMQNSRKEFSD